ncbi:MAG: phenylacetic acid degradation protein PaaN [Sheuella sp.]|nr:phenylacetic acid degradation protein PaaN [Sheuella sp.]
MSVEFFTHHETILNQALAAANARGYWSPFSEMPSPRVYGETANDDAKLSFDAQRGKAFAGLNAGTNSLALNEISPFDGALGISYPKTNVDSLIASSTEAWKTWRRAGPRAWVGVSLEILHRLNRASFDIAYAVQHTTGQGFMMAFQAGGPHAQDRGVEAVTYAWQEMSRIPSDAEWIKPQGKNDPIRMHKHFSIVPRGIALVIGCSTFPTWNGYPGMFASLATGNTVIVKPHPSAILPLALTVRIAREVLQEAGFNPDVVMLAVHDAKENMAQELALRPEVKIIDFTGSSTNGNWLEANARQAQVYTEKSGVNQIIIDSAEDIKGVARNIAFSLALYSGQMCTAPQNIYVPASGIHTAAGHVSFDEVAGAIASSVQKLMSDPSKAVEVTGAIQNAVTEARIDEALALGLPVLADSQLLAHPQFPDARVRTPLILRASSKDAAISKEWFGPIAFVVATDSTAHSIEIATQMVQQHGALSLAGYTTDPVVRTEMQEAAEIAGVSLSLNLTGAVFVNQTAAFSDFHGTGANPAANAALSDSAFVANRFRVVQTRWHA